MKKIIPSFWVERTFVSWLLYPASVLFQWLCYLISKRTVTPYNARACVICVGNVTLGGAGKTPVVIYLAQLLKRQGKKVVIVAKGYGGKIKKPTRVLPEHRAVDVGDEALLLAQHALTIVSYDRFEGVAYADSLEPHVILMDDGFQNPSVSKDVTLLVVDGSFGVGNGFLLPAGPMREQLDSACKRADMALWVGNSEAHILLQSHIKQFIPLLYVKIIPAYELSFGGKYIAFAGIGNPQKFFDTLREASVDVVDCVVFQDHHGYTSRDLDLLVRKAKDVGARLITTEKDFVKVDSSYHDVIDVFPITLEMNNSSLLRLLLDAGL